MSMELFKAGESCLGDKDVMSYFKNSQIIMISIIPEESKRATG
jgi:hypothetical protein